MIGIHGPRNIETTLQCIEVDMVRRSSSLKLVFTLFDSDVSESVSVKCKAICSPSRSDAGQTR